jgi:hypothetical protein
MISNGAIYVHIRTSVPFNQTDEIWRFAPNETQAHTVVYSKLLSQAGVINWDVNELGTLVVQEQSHDGTRSVKVIVPGVSETLVPGSELTAPNAAYVGVLINTAGLIGAIRHDPSVVPSFDELLYAPAGGAFVRVLATGDSLNGTPVVALMPTSMMNESGQFSFVAQVRPLGGPINSTLAIATPLFPTIESLTPASGVVGSSVIITGTHFTGATGVVFNGTSASFVVDSDKQITATVPVGATTGAVAITTPAGSVTSSTTFTVTVPPPVPTISTFTPSSGPVGTSVSIAGTNLTGTTAVAFNGTSATFTVNSPTQIAATVPLGATTGLISVATPAGNATSATAFTVTTTQLAPTITSFSPSGGAVGSSVTLKGTNFTGTTAVTFNGVSATFKLKGASQIAAIVPAGATTGPIAVTASGGTAATSSSFTIAPAPAIVGLSPNTGPAGTTVVITGSGFVDVTSVTFNGAKASFSSASDTTITAVVPKGAKSGPVKDSAFGGSATSGSSFTETK